MDVKIELTASPELLAVLKTIADALAASKTPASKNGNGIDFKAAAKKEKEKEASGSNGAEKVTVTIEQIRAMVRKKSDEKKKPAIIKLLSEYHVENVTSLDEEQYPSFYTDIQAL
jgi:hypothetical protein